MTLLHGASIPLDAERRHRERDESFRVRLTPSEARVADLLAEGRSNAEIAETLVLAERTVKAYVSRVLDKLGARNRREAAALWTKGQGQ